MHLFCRACNSKGALLPFCERRLVPKLAAPAVGAPFSTDESLPLPEGWQDNLWNRVYAAGDPRRSIVPVLERWVAEGNSVEKSVLQGLVKQMRSCRRYAHALQISTWMSDRRYFELKPGDIAYRLDLIKKIHGLQQAESYFSCIPKQLKVYQVYGSLLNCYVEEKCVEKAEALFHKMEEMSMLSTFSYNMLIKLYTEIGQLAKVDIIFQEMEKKNFIPDIFTYNNLIEAYAKGANTEAVEKVLKSIEQSNNAANWHTYAVAAKGYVKAGLVDEALALLKESEKQIPKKRSRVCYGFLLSVYADIGNKDEMYRVWNLYRTSGRVANSMYMSMISGLLKLDEIECAEDILEEWESVVPFYDFRVPNLLLSAYCKKGLIEKAELLMKKVTERGVIPLANSWERLAGLYFTCGQNAKAVESMKKALAKEQIIWKPNPTTIATTLEYLKEQKDAQGAEEIARLLRNRGLLTREIYNCLLKIYVSAGKPTTDLLDQMRKDGFDADEETCKILGEEGQKKPTISTRKIAEDIQASGT
ncbi:hypothetical protein Cni_G08926 [Canna indica]|uniref:Pentatricopeptide repeat-containing protein n=1 Tax=Canna indica TaxID=4628 RepID=A0AAQ3K1K0_9LILI|nr:hypothetical protein Cni_G08926 [Canna indica]